MDDRAARAALETVLGQITAKSDALKVAVAAGLLPATRG
jgi:hypothetical protein